MKPLLESDKVTFASASVPGLRSTPAVVTQLAHNLTSPLLLSKGHPSPRCQHETPVSREAIYTWDRCGLLVLVPKRSGPGFLRVPYGAHSDTELTDIGNAIGADLCGLDGYLAFDLRRGRFRNAHHDAIVLIVMPMLAKHFGFSAWREDDRAFWAALLPAG